jgi:hypothetical protein
MQKGEFSLLLFINFKKMQIMKEKIKYTLFVLLITLASTANGQNGFLSSNHSYHIDGNELQLFLEAEFTIGYGICDFLDTCIINVINDTIFVNAIYDISGFNPQTGCTAYDTLSYNVSDGTFTLTIESDIVFADSNNTVDTAKVSIQSFPNLILSVNSEFSKNNAFYPNPAKDVLHIEVNDDIQFESIEIFDTSGKKVKTFNTADRNLNISGLSSGTYSLKLLTQEGILTKKVIIE